MVLAPAHRRIPVAADTAGDTAQVEAAAGHTRTSPRKSRVRVDAAEVLVAGVLSGSADVPGRDRRRRDDVAQDRREAGAAGALIGERRRRQAGRAVGANLLDAGQQRATGPTTLGVGELGAMGKRKDAPDGGLRLDGRKTLGGHHRKAAAVVDLIIRAIL